MGIETRITETHEKDKQVAAPFRLETLEKIAQSQMDSECARGEICIIHVHDCHWHCIDYIDIIKALHLSDENGAFKLFSVEVESLTRKDDDAAKKDGAIARQVGT